MKTQNLKSFFSVTAMAIALLLTSCGSKEPTYTIPEIAADPLSLSFEAEGGSQTVKLTSNRTWTATPSADWIAVNPASTTNADEKSTTTNITVTVSANSSTQRTGTIKFVAGMVDVTITVEQASGVVEPTTIYYDNFDKSEAVQTGTKWPFVADFTGWNPTGEGASGVTYTGTNATVRNTSNSNGNFTTDTYKATASGVNNVFFATAAQFMINGISLGGQTNLQLTFGCERFLYGAADNTFQNSEFHVYVSGDGQKWSEVTYTRPKDAGTGGTWDLATADFSLATAPDKLYIAFTSDLASAHRLDDVRLTVGQGGTSIDLSKGTELGGGEQPATEMTIAEVLAAGSGKSVITNGTVVATYAQGFLLQDATGYLLIYLKAVPTNQIGDKVKVTGTTGTFGGLVQITNDPVPTIEKTGTETVTYPTPTVMDGAAMDAYLSSVKVSYVEYTGILTISGSYYNVEVDGAATAIGSISYPNDGMVASTLNGKTIKVTGYTIGMSSSKYVNTMATSVAEVEPTGETLEVTPTTIEWTAEQTDAKSVTVTASAEWSFEATDMDWATVEKTESGLTVTPKAANTANAANAGSIAISCGTRKVTVTATQAAVVPEGSASLTVGFESSEGFAATTSYNNADVILTGNEGKQWGTVYGTPSTTSPITGSQSMQMRWYATDAAKDIFGYTYTNFTVENVKGITFSAKNTYGMKVKLSYSTDGGTTWVAGQTYNLTTTATTYSYQFESATTIRVRFDVVQADTVPTATSRVYLDDVSFFTSSQLPGYPGVEV